jgi:hypothetical protein
LITCNIPAGQPTRSPRHTTHIAHRTSPRIAMN